jgi:succinyl-CoA synthetase alpha subunit
VTPGKGGTTHEGWPIFNTVREGVEKTGANATVIFVPPPVRGRRHHGSCRRRHRADRLHHRRHSCDRHGEHVGVSEGQELAADRAQLSGHHLAGQVQDRHHAGHIHKEGNVGIVSRSGTLTYEAVYQLTTRGIGQSTAIGIGGDPIIGTNFVDALACSTTIRRPKPS